LCEQKSTVVNFTKKVIGAYHKTKQSQFTRNIYFKSRFMQLHLATNHRDKKSFHVSRGNNVAPHGS